MFRRTGPAVKRYPECGHFTHVGSCPSCQRVQLDRAKNHVVQSMLARARWEEQQANLSVSQR